MKPIIAVCLFLTALSPAFADTLLVPGAYPTIQEAIGAAQDSDVVLVDPGTYLENINFLGKPITVRSTHGFEQTVIDGSLATNPERSSTVLFENQEGNDSVLDGFTITNGAGTYLESRIFGGGICCYKSSPIISNNRITGNTIVQDLTQFAHGGGIGCKSASPVIINNVIENNSAETWGGGIGCLHASAPLITNNLITGNIAKENPPYGGGNGAGIGCLACSAVIVNNTITSNLAEGFGGGGGIEVFDESPTIAYNRIIGNEAFIGGGIDASGGSPTVTHNFVAENTCGQNGGGISCTFFSGELSDNIILDNTADWQGGGLKILDCTLTVTKNIISGNMAEEGGGIYHRAYATSTFSNNMITNNMATEYGAGIHFYQHAYKDPSQRNKQIVTSTTIAGNGTLDTIRGGGIGCRNQLVSVTNSIIWDNQAKTGPAIWTGKTKASSRLSISYSDLENGQSGVYIQPDCQFIHGQGMLDQDPLFVDKREDYHLTFFSPCRDAGDNSLSIDPYDFEGDPRITLGSIDMGADEFYTHLYTMPLNPQPGESLDIKLIDLPGTAPVYLWAGSYTLDLPIPTVYGDWYLGFPLHLNLTLGAIPSNGVTVLSTTLPPDLPTLLEIPLQAFIGDRLTNHSLLELYD